MNIAVCESDKTSAQRLKKYLLDYKTKNLLSLEITQMDDISKILSEKREGEFDVIFASSEFFKGSTGKRTLLRMLRLAMKQGGYIVLISDGTEFLDDNYETLPFGLIVRPVTKKTVFKIADNLVKHSVSDKRAFVFERNGMRNIFFASKISYISSYGRKVIMHTGTREISVYGSLNEIAESECFRDFIRIHCSFLVNPDYVLSLDRGMVYIDNHTSDVLPISRSRRKQVLDQLIMG